MITVLHRGVLENYYRVSRILEYYIRNIISKDLTKDQVSFLVDKNLYFVGYVKIITVLHEGGIGHNDYSIRQMDCSDRGGMHCKVLLSYFR